MPEIRYVTEPATYLVKAPGGKPNSTGSVHKLLGARLHVDPAGEVDGFLPATDMRDDKGAARSGFVDAALTSTEQQLKVFYLDVGQGDATLIEAQGAVVIIDGGPNSGFKKELDKRLKQLRRADADAGLPQRARLVINAVIISHFDADHYAGIVHILKSDDYEVQTLYHNGLPRYGDESGKDLTLGDVVEHDDGSRSISTDFRDFDSARDLLASDLLLTKKGNLNDFGKFLEAALKASDEGRLGAMKLLVRRKTADQPSLLPNTGPDMQFEILGPVSTKATGSIRLPAFPNPHKGGSSPSESHTINGNSVVLRLRYGDRRFLFGGDLNQPAQAYLSARYPDMAAFAADVNKACHHGSSDFDLPYLKAVEPDATVFSSGDNGSFDHPLPDAIGAAARHSRGEFPLVFSTELARETSSGGVKLGHINARSNGQLIVMAQKKEKPSLKKKWHAFPLPFDGPFGSH